MINEITKEKKNLLQPVLDAYQNGKRIVAPLVGFPGLNLTGSTIKLAQQNYDEHFKVVRANVETFQPDAVFPLMDLSVEANALGRYTVFPKEESATVVKDIFNVSMLDDLNNINIQCDARLLSYVDTLKLMTAELPSTILRGAYVTGPYTLAGLLMGADEAAIATVMSPDELHDICKFAVRKVKEYASLLVSAGAQMICILEPSAVMLGPEHFEEYSGRYVQKIVEEYEETDIALIYHVCGNTMHLIENMCASGVNALSLDSADSGVNLPLVAEKIPEDIVLIGNINPVGKILNGKPQEVELEATNLLKSMNSFPNFILSTGCDLPQETPIENIKAFMNAGRSFTIS